MADQKQDHTSGKPNKFNEQNKGTEDRKAADNAPKREPIVEPTKTDTPAPTAETQNR